MIEDVVREHMLDVFSDCGLVQTSANRSMLGAQIDGFHISILILDDHVSVHLFEAGKLDCDNFRREFADPGFFRSLESDIRRFAGRRNDVDRPQIVSARS